MRPPLRSRLNNAAAAAEEPVAAAIAAEAINAAATGAAGGVAPGGAVPGRVVPVPLVRRETTDSWPARVRRMAAARGGIHRRL
jgi:hypothetical protein